MLQSPYKVKHWSPVKRIPKSIDCWWNILEWEDIEADLYKSEVEQSTSDFFYFFLFFACRNAK